MNKLLGFGLGRHCCVMQEAGEGGGGGGADSADSADNGGASVAAASDGDAGASEVAKPYLGEKADDGATDAKPGEEGDKAGGEGKAAPASEADYLKAVVKDEALLGDDKGFQLDQGLVKAMIPKAQELGVSPEAFNKLANSFAKAQIDSAKDAVKRRMDYFGKMKEESMRKYTPGDFEQINAGIDHWFKPNGVMNNVIRNSELGADPEFLALMHFMGSRRVMDSVRGAAEGGGGSGADPNSTEGLSKIW